MLNGRIFPIIAQSHPPPRAELSTLAGAHVSWLGLIFPARKLLISRNWFPPLIAIFPEIFPEMFWFPRHKHKLWLDVTTVHSPKLWFVTTDAQEHVCPNSSYSLPHPICRPHRRPGEGGWWVGPKGLVSQPPWGCSVPVDNEYSSRLRLGYLHSSYPSLD